MCKYTILYGVIIGIIMAYIIIKFNKLEQIVVI